MTTNQQNFGSELKKYLKDKNIKLNWLADKLAVSRQGLYYMLQKNNISLSMIKKIAKSLNLKVRIDRNNIELFENENTIKKTRGNINVRELKIGNHVIVNGVIERVVSITENKVNNVSIEMIKPLFLSKEEYEKCSFIFDDFRENLVYNGTDVIEKYQYVLGFDSNEDDYKDILDTPVHEMEQKILPLAPCDIEINYFKNIEGERKE